MIPLCFFAELSITEKLGIPKLTEPKPSLSLLLNFEHDGIFGFRLRACKL